MPRGYLGVMIRQAVHRGLALAKAPRGVLVIGIPLGAIA